MMESSPKKRYVDASRMLQERRLELISRFFPKGEPGFLEKHTRLLDDYFRESFENSMIGPEMGIEKNPYAIIALGGYGRREQCVHSDVDILFLFKKELPKKAEALIGEIIYPLWDIGLDIGHATRSLKECIHLASRDFEVLMSLLDARFVCGMSPLYSEMAGRVRERIVFRRARRIVDWLAAQARERHRLFGDSACLLEPNLKEGLGGLRDYHALLWLSRVRFHLEAPRDLETHGHLSHAEYREFEQALAFVWKVRSGLHLLVRRKYDRLHFAHQVELAERFDYREGSRREAVERFLGELHGHMEVIRRTHCLFFEEAALPKRRFRIHRNPEAVPAGGVVVRRTALAFASVKAVMDAPDCLVRIFEESARLGLPLDREASRLVREFRHRLAPDVVRLPAAVRALEQVLLRPVSAGREILGEMHTAGILLQFVPEMKGVVNRIEYDTYHVHPVDRHLLGTVAAVAEMNRPGDEGAEAWTPSVDRELCRTLTAEISDLRPLAWAALLHDAGKGFPDPDHAEAGERISRSVLARLGYPGGMIETVAFLVRSHRLLPHTATRRDIDNEETARRIAREIGGVQRLKMLYLLSVADLRATGPKAWNEWTAALLRSLFLKVRRLLSAGGAAASGNVVRAVGEKTREVMAMMRASRDRSDAESLLGVMSPRYLLGVHADEIRVHLDLFRGLGTRPFVWRIDRMPESGTRKVSVLGRNVPGFFSSIAGVFALNRMDVLDARVHTWRNHTAICTFTVTPPPDPLFEEERWHRAARELSAVISGKLDIRQALGEHAPQPSASDACPLAAPDRVHVDNSGSGGFTILEVHTRDMPGLLYRLTRAIFQCGLDIWSARIATRSEQVVDVFYVRDFDGRKIATGGEIDRVRARIAAVLPRAREGPSPGGDRPPEAACNGAA